MNTEPKPTDLTDAELLRDYQLTDGEPDDPIAEALLAEIQRRNLDF